MEQSIPPVANRSLSSTLSKAAQSMTAEKVSIRELLAAVGAPAGIMGVCPALVGAEALVESPGHFAAALLALFFLFHQNIRFMKRIVAFMYAYRHFLQCMSIMQAISWREKFLNTLRKKPDTSP